jgi:hypothetical protein
LPGRVAPQAGDRRLAPRRRVSPHSWRERLPTWPGLTSLCCSRRRGDSVSPARPGARKIGAWLPDCGLDGGESGGAGCVRCSTSAHAATFLSARPRRTA